MIDWLVDGLPGLLLLAAFGLLGVSVLRRSQLGLSGLECVAYGPPVGIVSMSLMLLIVTSATESLSRLTIAAFAAASVIVAIFLLASVRRPSLASTLRRTRFFAAKPSVALLQRRYVLWTPSLPTMRRAMPALLLLGFVVYQASFWSRALRYDDGELVTGLPGVWADWGMHLSDIASFVWGSNFPVEHPRLVGAPMSYHYLSSFTAAAMAKLGPDPVVAMTIQSFFLFLCIGVGVYAFGLRVIGLRFAALLLVPLYLLGGGYGWVALAARMRPPPTDPLSVFEQRFFGRELLRDLNFPLPNPEFMFIPQRGFLYGLPLALLTFTLLLMAMRRIRERIDREVQSSDGQPGPAVEASGLMSTILADRPTGQELRPFLAAGVVAGIIPIGHFSTVYSLMLALPAIALLSLFAWPVLPVRLARRRTTALMVGWAVFGVLWVALTVPQVMWVYGGQIGGTSAPRLQVGWLAGDEPLWYFWLKNLGTYALLFPVAIFTRGLVDAVAHRFLLGFTSIFILCNLFAFLPWDWNNALFLQYWFLSVAVFTAALLGKAWAKRRTPVVIHVALLITFGSIIGLGLMSHLDHVTGSERRVLADQSGIELASWIRTETAPDAVFITGTYYSNPVAMLSGRQLVVGYPVYLWTQGLDASQHESDIHTVLQWKPGAQELLEKHDVDYVAIGPWEREHLGAGRFASWSLYPRVFTSNLWDVFAVSPRAIAQYQTALVSDPDDYRQLARFHMFRTVFALPPASARSAQSQCPHTVQDDRSTTARIESHSGSSDCSTRPTEQAE